jgi:hypothetical protein
MNLTLVKELTFYLKGECNTVLFRGDAIPEIQEAAHRNGLKVRVIGPEEFSLPAIFEARRENLQAHRDDPAAVGFWTGLRQSLHIPSSVQVLVFRDVDQLDDTHNPILESVVKGDMDRPEEGIGFKYIWATSNPRATLGSRLVFAFQRVVEVPGAK